MSPERVLANPLSGEEIVRAVGDKVMNALRRDCYLTPNLAYDWYEADVKISVRAHDVGRLAEVVKEVHDEQGQAPEGEDSALDVADAEFHVDAAPPNEVRVETGQDVPVLTKNADGKPEVKGVRYARSRVKAAQ